MAHATALNPALVEALSKAASAATDLRKAGRDDFAMVKRRGPSCWRGTAKRHRPRVRSSAARLTTPCSTEYDGRPLGRDRRVFDDLAKFLPGSASACWRIRRARPPVKPAGPFPIEKQRRSARSSCMRSVRFDMAARHQPASFCGGVPDDVPHHHALQFDDFAHSLMG